MYLPIMDLNRETPQEIEDLIVRFLRRETSAYEIRKLEEWLRQDPSHRIQFDEINTAYQALHSSYARKSPQEAWKSLSDKLEDKEIEMPIATRFSYLKIAATIALVLAVLAGTWKYTSPGNSRPSADLIAKAGDEKKQIVLPDGTIVWLNTGSSISYEKAFGVNNRNVSLTGEAFFDVAKTGIDFVVATNRMSIRVKGTRFNVTAFSNDDESATLEEGSVALTIEGHDQPIEMKPGDQVTFNEKSSEVTRKVVHAPSYSVWKEEEIHFDNSPLQNIVDEIDKRYKVNITIDPSIAAREHLSMTIREETLEEVLELITISSSLNYKIEGNQVKIYEHP